MHGDTEVSEGSCGNMVSVVDGWVRMRGNGLLTVGMVWVGEYTVFVCIRYLPVVEPLIKLLFNKILYSFCGCM